MLTGSAPILESVCHMSPINCDAFVRVRGGRRKKKHRVMHIAGMKPLSGISRGATQFLTRLVLTLPSDGGPQDFFGATHIDGNTICIHM